MSYKGIFLIGSAYKKQNPLPKGITGTWRLMKHSFRINKQTSQDFTKGFFNSWIDHERSHQNYWFNHEKEQWVQLNSKNKQNYYYQKVLKQEKEILKHFHQYHEAYNARMREKRNYKRIKSFADFMQNKQITGEWILSGSKEWFVRNKVIKQIDDKKYEVINQQKLFEWANTVQTWARKQIHIYYPKENFIGSHLHLDESNIHIHFNFFRHKYIWNEREQKMKYAFTNQGFLTRQKLISMQRDYTNFQNKVLFEDLQWEKTYTLDQPERGRKYLSLPVYKQVKQLEQERDRYRERLQEKSQELEQTIWKHLDHDLLKKLQQKLYIAVQEQNDSLYIEVIEGMKNLGLTDKMIHEQVEQTRQMVREI